MTEFSFQKLVVAQNTDNDFSADILTAENDVDLFCLSYSVKGENAAIFSRVIANSFAKIIWQNPETLHVFLQNSLKLAKNRDYELSFAGFLAVKSEYYFFTKGGSITLFHGQKIGTLLSSQDHRMIVGPLDSSDQLILSSSNDPTLSEVIGDVLIQSTQPEETFADHTSELREHSGAYIHLFPYNENVKKTVTTSKFPEKVAKPLAVIKKKKKIFYVVATLFVLLGLIFIIFNFNHISRTISGIELGNTSIIDASPMGDFTSIDGEAALFYDFNFALPNFQPQHVVRLGITTRAAFLDTNSNQIIVLDLLTRRFENHTLDDIYNIRDFTYLGGELVFLTNPLISLNLETGYVRELTPHIDYLARATDLTSFGRNLYVTVEGGIMMLEFNAHGEYIGDREWFREGTTLPASRVTSFTIDRSIFVTTYAGDWVKYQQGGRVNNFPRDDLSFTGPIFGYSNLDNRNLYLLDRNQGRLLITNNNGVLDDAIESDIFEQATGLLVIESLGRVFILVDHLIYATDI
ncbi:MAG: hypothetical protein LBG64_02810 [Pseudomonadales bacterium]|jgi:hypothetical protein|nr:hypothetical protein [Pseudomonadales bacterium]